MKILIDPFGTIFDCSLSGFLLNKGEAPLVRGLSDSFKKFLATNRFTFFVSNEMRRWESVLRGGVFPSGIEYYDGLLENSAKVVTGLNPKVFICSSPVLILRLRQVGFKGRVLVFDPSKILFKNEQVVNSWWSIAKRVLLVSGRE